MILDERTEFCDATALNTGAAGTYVIGDQIDISQSRDLGGEKAARLRIQMATSATGAGASGEFQLVSADNAALTTNPVVHYSSGAIAMASLSAGAVVADVEMPRAVYKRYVGILQVTSGSAFTGGTVDAFLVFDSNGWRAYTDGVAN